MILEVMSFGFLFTAVRSTIISAELCRYNTSFDTTCSGAKNCQDLCEDQDCDSLTTCDLLTAQLPEMSSLFSCYSTEVGMDAKVECEDDGTEFAGCDDDGVDICQRTCLSSNGQCEKCVDIPIDMSQFNLAGRECDEYRTVAPRFFENFTDFCECFTHTEEYDTSDFMIGCKGACSADSDSGAGSGSDNDDNAGAGSDNDDNASAGSDNDDDAGSGSDNDDNAGAGSDNDGNASAGSDNDDDAGSGSSSGSDNTVMIVGIVAGGVVLIAIITAVTICMRRTKL